MAAFAAVTLAGCGTASKSPSTAPPQRGGGYYLDDGPGPSPPADFDSIPDAVPRMEPLNRPTARPYTVMGRNYTPMTSLQPYRARGIATWYGRRYHGRQTSSGEIYDMYAMTAAHTTLPIPSYARVTNPANGRSVVVRINDRGPFVGGRLIDLSYTAAHKLGVLAAGSAVVEVESIIPGQTAPAAARDPGPAMAPIPPEPQLPAVPLAQEIPITSAGTGIYLQLGAFGSRENADNYLSRTRLQFEWLTDRLQLFGGDGLYRVQAGPYASRAEALRTVERIVQDLGIKPVVLTR